MTQGEEATARYDKASRRSGGNRWEVLLGVFGGLAVSFLLASSVQQMLAEKRLVASLEPWLTDEAMAEYRDIESRSRRVQLARTSLERFEKLADDSWQWRGSKVVLIKETQRHFFLLDVLHGPTRLQRCLRTEDLPGIFRPLSPPQIGQCKGFGHKVVLSDEVSRTIQYEGRVDLYREDILWGEVEAPIAVNVAAPGEVWLEGQVRVDESDLTLRDPQIAFPNPGAKTVYRLVLESYSAQETMDLKPNVPLELTYKVETPEFLTGIYGDELTLIDIGSSVSIDLRTPKPSFRLSGKTILLNEPLKGTVDLTLMPGEFFEVSLGGTMIPLPGGILCLKLQRASAAFRWRDGEIDAVRVTGRVAGVFPDSILCMSLLDSAPLDWLSKHLGKQITATNFAELGWDSSLALEAVVLVSLDSGSLSLDDGADHCAEVRLETETLMGYRKPAGGLDAIFRTPFGSWIHRSEGSDASVEPETVHELERTAFPCPAEGLF